jgi:hypothetical protein
MNSNSGMSIALHSVELNSTPDSVQARLKPTAQLFITVNRFDKSLRQYTDTKTLGSFGGIKY